MSTEYPLASKEGIAFMGWLVSAYETWAKLTRAQRKALADEAGTPRPVATLTRYGLWAVDGITPLGRFVRDVKAGKALTDYAVDDEGNLLVRIPEASQ